MIARREFLFAGACAAALGTAEWLRPRDVLLLLPDGVKLTSIIPQRFGGWIAGGGGDIVLPDLAGSLAARLYSERVARSYRRTTGDEMQDAMLLVAYGKSQSDVLQLHRPEVCYPATGFQIAFHKAFPLTLAPGVVAPAVMLTATLGDRVEDIVYWTRLGDTLPQTSGDQRWARLENSMHGIIPDGVLVRASMIRYDSAPMFPALEDFMRAMMLGIQPVRRAAMIGDTLAKRMPGAIA